MSHLLKTEKVEGGKRDTAVSDEYVRYLLEGILKELKIANLHLAFISGEEIHREEVE